MIESKSYILTNDGFVRLDRFFSSDEKLYISTLKIATLKDGKLNYNANYNFSKIYKTKEYVSFYSSYISLLTTMDAQIYSFEDNTYFSPKDIDNYKDGKNKLFFRVSHNCEIIKSDVASKKTLFDYYEGKPSNDNSNKGTVEIETEDLVKLVLAYYLSNNISCPEDLPIRYYTTSNESFNFVNKILNNFKNKYKINLFSIFNKDENPYKKTFYVNSTCLLNAIKNKGKIIEALRLSPEYTVSILKSMSDASYTGDFVEYSFYSRINDKDIIHTIMECLFLCGYKSSFKKLKYDCYFSFTKMSVDLLPSYAYTVNTEEGYKKKFYQINFSEKQPVVILEELNNHTCISIRLSGEEYLLKPYREEIYANDF